MQLDESDLVHIRAMSAAQGLGFAEPWRYGRLGRTLEPAIQGFSTRCNVHGGGCVEAWQSL